MSRLDVREALEPRLTAVGLEVRPGDLSASAVDGVVPSVVAAAHTPEQVAQALAIANEAGAAVLPRGAGSKLHLGNPPRAADIILDLSALRSVLAHEPADLTVTAQAGVPLAELQQMLGQAGQFLPLDPPYATRATLGGALATNSSGPSRLLYGTARDLVLGTRWASPEGELVRAGGRVVKNAAGYDLTKMHIGALGTLGVLVEVSLKAYPLPQAEATVWAAFDTLAAAHGAANRISRSALYPRAVELLDRSAATALALAEVAGTTSAMADRAAEDQGHVVLTWCSGSAATTARQARDADAWCREAGALATGRLDGQAHTLLWSRVREFGRDLPAQPCVLTKVSLLPSHVGEVFQVARDAATRLRLRAALLAHAGSGITYATAVPDGGPLALEDLTAFVRTLVDTASRLDGSAVVEWCPPQLKERLDVWGPTRHDLRLMQALKAELDPRQILNPGRFVGRI